MNIHQTITLKTKIAAMSVGYDNFPISQNVIPTGEHRKTCTAMMLHEWIRIKHGLIVETKHDESQMWGYILFRIDMKDSTEAVLTYIDNDSLFESEEVAFDEGLQRALYEIKCNSK
jgi:hypothetical protein